MRPLGRDWRKNAHMQNITESRKCENKLNLTGSARKKGHRRTWRKTRPMLLYVCIYFRNDRRNMSTKLNDHRQIINNWICLENNTVERAACILVEHKRHIQNKQNDGETMNCWPEPKKTIQTISDSLLTGIWRKKNGAPLSRSYHWNLNVEYCETMQSRLFCIPN